MHRCSFTPGNNRCAQRLRPPNDQLDHLHEQPCKRCYMVTFSLHFHSLYSMMTAHNILQHNPYSTLIILSVFSPWASLN